MPELLIVAGASCTGKSTLIEDIQAGRADDRLRQMGIEPGEGWNRIRMSALPPVETQKTLRSLVHLDLSGMVRETGRAGRVAKLMDYACHFDTVHVLTLYADVLTVRKRSRSRFFYQISSVLKILFRRRRLPTSHRWERFRHVFSRYRNHSRRKHRLRYQLWMDAIGEGQNLRTWLLDTSAAASASDIQADEGLARLRALNED